MVGERVRGMLVEPVSVEVVAASRARVGVACEVLHDMQRHASVERRRDRRMAKAVRADPLRDACALGDPDDELRDVVPVEGVPRRRLQDESGRAVADHDVEGLTRRRVERHDAAAAARSVFLDPSTAEKRKPGGQVGSARAKDRIGAARRDHRAATGLDPRVYGSMPIFDDEGNPIPLVQKAGETRFPRRAA